MTAPSDPLRDENSDRSNRLSRQSLGSQIANSLRNDILFGRLPPGTRLAQQQLCEEFGTSRMPVRDALRQLTYEGFLLTDRGNHVVVTRFRRDDLHDIYFLEGVVHGRATRRATERASQDELAQLVRMNEAMLGAERDNDPSAMAQLNWAFHRGINLAARSPKLLTTIRALSLNVVRDYLVEIPEWMTRSNLEHHELLDAMLERDAAKAEQLMQAHITQAGQHLISYLETQGLALQD